MTKALPRCLSCDEPRSGLFCAPGGENRISAEDRTVGPIAAPALEAVTHANGKLFLTLITLLRHPGRLTADSVPGRRKPYIPPLQLFFLANLVFFLLHP